MRRPIVALYRRLDLDGLAWRPIASPRCRARARAAWRGRGKRRGSRLVPQRGEQRVRQRVVDDMQCHRASVPSVRTWTRSGPSGPVSTRTASCAVADARRAQLVAEARGGYRPRRQTAHRLELRRGEPVARAARARLRPPGREKEGPSSTLWSIERAVSLGVTAIELDVHATADGELVVGHDPTLRPASTNRPSGAIAKTTREEISPASTTPIGSSPVRPRFAAVPPSSTPSAARRPPTSGSRWRRSTTCLR